VGARFSASVQTGPGAHPASCTMGSVSFLGIESGRGVTLTPHPLLVPRSKNRVELYVYLYSPQGPSWPIKRVKPTYSVSRRLIALLVTTQQVQRLTYYEFIFVSLMFTHYSSKLLKYLDSKLFVLRKENTLFFT
jgi:hypothetical protein